MVVIIYNQKEGKPIGSQSAQFNRTNKNKKIQKNLLTNEKPPDIIKSENETEVKPQNKIFKVCRVKQKGAQYGKEKL